MVERNETRQQIRQIYAALQERGYNPAMQLAGYILTEDPTYITNHGNARKLAARIDRDELLRDIVAHYFPSARA